MLEYHAAYYEGDDGWIVAFVLDFPAREQPGENVTFRGA